MNKWHRLHSAFSCLVILAVLLAVSLMPWAGRSLGWAVNHPTSNDQLLRALAREDTAALSQALQEGADPNQRLPAGSTPLLLAATSHDQQLVCLLLSYGARPNARGAHCFSALHLAAMRGRIENVRALLDCGADVDCETDRGETPLMAAVRAGQTAVAALLLEKGAAAAGTADCRERILVEAVGSPASDPAMLRLLIAAGADPDAPDARGVTPLQAARLAKREDLAAVLRQARAEQMAGRHVAPATRSVAHAPAT